MGLPHCNKRLTKPSQKEATKCLDFLLEYRHLGDKEKKRKTEAQMIYYSA
jgi:hypothetical protein